MYLSRVKMPNYKVTKDASSERRNRIEEKEKEKRKEMENDNRRDYASYPNIVPMIFPRLTRIDHSSRATFVYPILPIIFANRNI